MAGTDPNQVCLTGENSFIRLGDTADGPVTTRTSHWRVLWSPAGAGHVLFIQGTFTSGQVDIYSDNIALTRWLQGEIESMLHPPFADQQLPVIDASFDKEGDGRAFWTERIDSQSDSIQLTWYDFCEPFMINVAAGSVEGRPHGVYSCFLPARRAQLTVNGNVAPRQVFMQDRDGHESSTACVAWSETWVRPSA